MILFLAKEKDTEGYGIEDLSAYVQNGAAFKEVLTQQEKTESFIQDMNLQIERLTSPYLNQHLRHFLKQVENHEAGLMPFDEWLGDLKSEANKHLELDLMNPINAAQHAGCAWDWVTFMRHHHAR